MCDVPGCHEFSTLGYYDRWEICDHCWGREKSFHPLVALGYYPQGSRMRRFKPAEFDSRLAMLKTYIRKASKSLLQRNLKDTVSPLPFWMFIPYLNGKETRRIASILNS